MNNLPRTVYALGVLIIGLSASARAGNVFMKNGYIIQGPIIERADGLIVMGWENGKVTIHQRFIESIVYEPSEEKKLQERESVAGPEGPVEDMIGILGTTQEPDELPMDPESLVRKFVINASGPPKREDESSGATPGDGQQVAVETVVRPDDLLGARFEDEALGLAFRPPKGWVAEKKEDFLWAAPIADGFRPSLHAIRVSKGPLTVSEYVAIVKEENAQLLEDFELLNEGPRSQGGLQAHELLGRGTRWGRTAIVRQILVEGKQATWLVSSFVPALGSESAAPLIEESLRTFEFNEK